ncbi:MAG TPA: RidA family protein [Acidimicrobiales bacterium]|nr:RidA family protein [Acidimicrobiales bacterium]
MSTPVGPYTPALRVGPWLVCSGQIGAQHGPDGLVLLDGLEAQTRQAMANVGELLAGRGLAWGNVVKTTVFLADIADYGAFNTLYMELLGTHRPARSLVAVAGLPLGALVEIEAWAYAEG